MAENVSYELDEDDVEETEDTLEGKYLTFSVGKEDYGIAISYVIEIIGRQEITDVPELPNYVKGFINLRGKIIPVIDVRLKFKMSPVDYNDRTCIVVIAINETYIGLIVETISDVISIPEQTIVPPPDKKTGFNNRYIKGIGKVDNDVKLLIDCDKLFMDEEMEVLSNI